MQVHARISKEWRNRMIFMSCMINGIALWFLRDGYISWPAEAQRHQQLQVMIEQMTDAGKEVDLKHLDKNPELVREWTRYAEQNNLPTKLPKERNASDLAEQRTIGGVMLLAGLIFVARFLLQYRKSVRCEGDMITGAEGETVQLDSIVEIDRRKWKNKGIAYAIYEVNGRRKRLCLDDHKFLGCEEIILEAERRIEARKANSDTAPAVGETA